jgi:antitoxin component HigA of HigAB toxin-antitoxin module
MPEVAAALIVALAEIRQVTVADLEAERAGGDLEMASPEAVAAISAVEHQFGRRLAKVEDLEPEQLSSLANLADLLHRRWPAGTPLPSGSGS